MEDELILFIISIIPVFLLGIFIYEKDKQKEPTKLLIKLFLGGIGSSILVIIISLIQSSLNKILEILPTETSEMNTLELIIYVFLGIALVEEFCKWIVAYKISYKNDNFDEFYDGILYCVFVALGFALFENLLYVYSNGIGTGIIRALSAVPSHACDGVIMGYYLGLAKISNINNNKKLKNKNLILSIIVPTLTHGIYDYCLFSGKTILILFFYIYVIITYIYVYKKINKVSSINRKIKYKNNYCPNCGYKVEDNYCPNCGRKNE